MGDKPSNYATSTCLNPKRVLVRMSEDSSVHEIYCNCGRCIRCQDNKRNELATRMFLHSLDFEYCYYITLTYGSYNLLPFDEHPFLSNWLQTVPNYDNFNEYHHDAWGPSIIVQSHLTNFLKRLRKQLGFEISYAACGEYGSTYGRPHFHLILWSHNKITPDKISDAWSLDCLRTGNNKIVKKWRGASSSFKDSNDYAYLLRKYNGDIPLDVLKQKDPNYFKFRIGRIDFNDLWANGSLNYDGKHPGISKSKDTNKNAMYNFTYVAKYLGKSDPMTFTSSLPLKAIYRIKRAFAYYSFNSDELQKLMPDPATHDLLLFDKISKRINFDNYEFTNIDFFDFKKIVSPFFGSSRRPSLGKLYFLKNKSRFLNEIPTLPKFMGASVSFPAYFSRLIQQEKYPLRLRKVVPSGVSLTKDVLPRVYDYFQKLRDDSRYWFSVRGFNSYTQENRPRFDIYTLNGSCESAGCLDSMDFLDANDGVLHYYYNPYDEIFEGYRFDPTLKDYVFVEYLDRIDFCDMVLDLIESEYDRYPEKLQRLIDRYNLMNCILEDPESELRINEFLSARHKLDVLYQIENKKIF